MLVPPSPKFHCHEVGLPVDVSVNCTDWPAAGEVGLELKDALSMATGKTVMIWVALFVAEPLPIVNITVCVPEAVKE